jgi:hypothetical protein
MEGIAWSRGLVVRFKEMDGSQGSILMNKDDGIITINPSIKFPVQRIKVQAPASEGTFYWDPTTSLVSNRFMGQKPVLV